MPKTETERDKDNGLEGDKVTSVCELDVDNCLYSDMRKPSQSDSLLDRPITAQEIKKTHHMTQEARNQPIRTVGAACGKEPVMTAIFNPRK